MDYNKIMDGVSKSLTSRYIDSLTEDDDFFDLSDWTVSVEDEDKIVVSTRITLADFFFNYTSGNKSYDNNSLYSLHRGITKSAYREYKNSGSIEDFDDWFFDRYDLVDFYICPTIVLTFDSSGCIATTHVWLENPDNIFGYGTMDFGYNYQKDIYYTDYYDGSDTSIVQGCLDLFKLAMFDLMFTV